VIASSPVLAHQGGWDEMLMVLVPILIFAGLLVVANRRASRIGEQQSLAADGGGPGPDRGASPGPNGGGGSDRPGVGDDSDRGSAADPRRSDGRAGP
jgi:hypothetical protein